MIKFKTTLKEFKTGDITSTRLVEVRWLNTAFQVRLESWCMDFEDSPIEESEEIVIVKRGGGAQLAVHTVIIGGGGFTPLEVAAGEDVVDLRIPRNGGEEGLYYKALMKALKSGVYDKTVTYSILRE